MTRTPSTLAATFVSLALAGAAAAQQQSGTVGAGMPEDIVLEVEVTPDAVTLSDSEFRLAHGGYYRFNLHCPEGMENEEGVLFTAPELIENAHMRILSVGDPDSDDEINFHLQGLSFRQIDCEGIAAAARFSFHPMRKGTYAFTVRADVDPPREAGGQIIVE